jgi:hypothetical protein
MLSAEAAEGPLPAAVRLHLRRCRRCGRRRQRLLRLAWHVRQAPAADDPVARARVAAAVARRAAARPAAPRRPRRRWPWAAAAAVAALALTGVLAWAVLPKRPSPAAVAGRRDPPGADAPGSPAGRGRDDLVARVVHHDVSLAEADGPADQVRALAALAADLWAEAERRARGAGRYDLALLARLYERVVGEGVVGRARALDAGPRRDLLPPVLAQLQGAAGAADRLADAAPALVRLSAAARDAARALETNAGPPPPRPAPPDGGPRDLLETLVVQGLGLAEEDDPVKRADRGLDVADRLAQSIAESSESNDGDGAALLSDCLAEVRDRAVQGNLDRAAAAELDAARRQEFERVRRRADQAGDALEKVLNRAPPAARPGLTRALEAARDGPPGDDDNGIKDKDHPDKGKHGKGKRGPHKK